MSEGDEGRSFVGRAMDWVRSNHEEQPSLIAQLGAMWREGIKDVRQTMNETFFGHGEHMAEAGTPMNPTQQQVTNDLGNFHGYNDGKSFEQMMAESARMIPNQDQDRGMDR